MFGLKCCLVENVGNVDMRMQVKLFWMKYLDENFALEKWQNEILLLYLTEIYYTLIKLFTNVFNNSM